MQISYLQIYNSTVNLDSQTVGQLLFIEHISSYVLERNDKHKNHVHFLS